MFIENWWRIGDHRVAVETASISRVGSCGTRQQKVRTFWYASLRTTATFTVHIRCYCTVLPQFLMSAFHIELSLYQDSEYLRHISKLQVRSPDMRHEISGLTINHQSLCIVTFNRLLFSPKSRRVDTSLRELCKLRERISN